MGLSLEELHVVEVDAVGRIAVMRVNPHCVSSAPGQEVDLQSAGGDAVPPGCELEFPVTPVPEVVAEELIRLAPRSWYYGTCDIGHEFQTQHTASVLCETLNRKGNVKDAGL